MDGILPLLCCPATKEALRREHDALVCTCGLRFPVTDGIPRLLAPSQTDEEETLRERMQRFYERHTFPHYDRTDSPATLADKARRSGFGAWLDRAIAPFATVLDVGCGTGQLTNFLGRVETRRAIGIDMSEASLALGERFKEQWSLRNVHFLQGNIFAVPIRESTIDVLICLGVLHHTPSPREGFRRLLRLLKPGGHIIIGLYSRFARIATWPRRAIFSCTGSTFRILDPHLRRRDVDASKKTIWFADQYNNPHESWHSVDELLGWFDTEGVRFLSGVPAIAGTLPGEEESGTRLFEAHPRGTPFGHILHQIRWSFQLGREGGLFVLVGRKERSVYSPHVLSAPRVESPSPHRR